ncbi:hypothetical protein [Escherichia coli]|uniref:hypothetical protein n=3 Tax=Escherichia coli TaxID=562 RepID=UPI00388E4ECE
MFNRRVLFISVFSCAVFMLSGCSSNRFASRDANATYVNTQLKIIPRSQEKIQAQSQCSRSFSLLQKLNTDKFSMYRNQFDEINDAYYFYKRNVDLMNKDSKELMASVLDSKLDMVCVRVDNASFVGIYGKMKKSYGLINRNEGLLPSLSIYVILDRITVLVFFNCVMGDWILFIALLHHFCIADNHFIYFIFYWREYVF